MNGPSTDPPEPKTLRYRLNWRSAAVATVTALLMWLLARAFGGAGAFYDAARAARLSWLAASFGLATLCVLLGALRWKLVLRGMGYTLPFRRSLEVLLAVWPFVVVTPSRTNEFLRALGVENVVPPGAATTSVVAEKAVDLFLLLAISMIGAAMNGLWILVILVAGLLSVELVLIGIVMIHRNRVRVFGARFVEADVAFRSLGALFRAPATLAAVCTASIGIRLLTIGIMQALLWSVGAEVPWPATVTLWPLAIVAGLVPVTMAGMGTRDAAFVYLVARAGGHVDRATVFVATMGYSVIAIWSFALIGIPFMLREVLLRRELRR